ncbi:MAG TPA: nucleotidyl transferase AbiEii/AbiGii toxin family protein [bacterium]|nr:nucleotidyl transferase AbiEii/AbiGii toxin family protein [bacterium]
MHKEILSEEQLKILPLIKNFSSDFGLVGGTAIALQIGHRSSIDFDLFTRSTLNHDRIRKEIRDFYEIKSILVEEPNELTLVVEGVKITFLNYPFEINYSVGFEDVIKMPDVLTLSAMKAFALGKRAKWKDYVDLFFILKIYGISEVVNKAKSMFGSEFNERLFREQLSYFDDIDYTEKIDYVGENYVSDDEIKKFISDTSLQV